MIKIGDGYFKEDQIVGIAPHSNPTLRDHGFAVVYLSIGEAAVIRTNREDVERVVKALDGDSQDDNCSYVLTPSEIMELGNVQRTGATYIARDADGKVYAYSKKPYRDGAYWTTDSPFFRLKGDYDDLISSKDGPLEIKSVLEVN